MESLDRQCVILLVLLALSPAFDSIDHGIMLEVLERDLGVTGAAKKWFQSYVTGKSMRVTVDGTLTEHTEIRYGVPQDSCCGPTLFFIYCRRLMEIIKQYLPKVHEYSDDYQLYLAFRPSVEEDSSKVVEDKEACICAVKQWMIKKLSPVK